jgi:hypothetical protein
VDGAVVVKDWLLGFNWFKPVRSWHFTIGTEERHDVAIEKQNQFWLARLTSRRYRVFIDGELYQEYDGF